MLLFFCLPAAAEPLRLAVASNFLGPARELAERLTAERPATRVLYMSGYPDDAVVHHGVLEKDVAFLQKPAAAGTVLRKVREVLDGR